MCFQGAQQAKRRAWKNTEHRKEGPFELFDRHHLPAALVRQPPSTMTPAQTSHPMLQRTKRRATLRIGRVVTWVRRNAPQPQQQQQQHPVRNVSFASPPAPPRHHMLTCGSAWTLTPSCDVILRRRTLRLGCGQASSEDTRHLRSAVLVSGCDSTVRASAHPDCRD